MDPYEEESSDACFARQVVVVMEVLAIIIRRGLEGER